MVQDAPTTELEARLNELSQERDHFRKLYLETLERCVLLERGILVGNKAERFTADGSQLRAPGADAVAGMLAEVHEAHRTGEWQRLKACGNPDCQWVFYDASRNRSGRWCAMSECGDVMKARAYRARARRP